MSSWRASRTVVIQNAQGLHARPASLFVERAKQFSSRVWLVKDDRRVEAKQIFELLTLGAAQGTEVNIEAEGDDAEQAIEALAQLITEGFPDDDEEPQNVQRQASDEP